MKLLIPILLFTLSCNTLISEEFKRIGVNYSNTIGIYSLSPNLSDKSDIFQSIERYSVSYYSDIELRHLLENTKVVIKLGYSKYSLNELKSSVKSTNNCYHYWLLHSFIIN